MAAVTLALVATACSSGTAGGPTASSAANTRFAQPGPYAAGTARVVMANGDQLQLWYPVDKPAVQGQVTYTYHLRHWLTEAEATSPALTGMPDAVHTDSYLNAPMATDTGPSGDPDGSFPIVLFSHGSASYPEQSSFLTEHLAQWGFVVAAPDHRSRDLATVLADPAPAGAEMPADSDIDDLDNTLAYLHQQQGRSGSPVPAPLDFSKVGVLGHSSGGGTAVTMADSPSIRTYVALAPAPGTPPSTHKPGLIMYGSTDAVVPPASVHQLYETLPTPKRVIVIKDTGHNVFDDVCTAGANGKRMSDFLSHVTSTNEGLEAWANNVPDGCRPPDIFPTTARPLIDQATTAQMRYGVGIDKDPVGLDSGLDNAFPGISSTYAQKL
jgi:dienelactone hydrolase